MFAPFYPRIHVTLLDLTSDGYRSNGGLGFCLETGQPAGIRATTSDAIDVTRLSEAGFEESELQSITSALAELRRYHDLPIGLSVDSVTGVRSHSGFGSGTYVRLACLAMMLRMNDKTVDREEVIAFSGRGGASGVGLSTFFEGGMCFDLGRRRDAQPLTSSDFVAPGFIRPTQLARAPMPDWKCGLLIPSGVLPIPLAQEKRFFSSLLPLDHSSVYEATYHALLGVYGSVLDQDFDAFCKAINSLQTIGWKAAEIRLHGAVIADCMKMLRDLGCDAVGMSSFGPCLYFFARNLDEVFFRVRQQIPHDFLVSAKPMNSGCKLIDE